MSAAKKRQRIARVETPAVSSPVVITLARADAATVGATLRMLALTAPQPEVREALARVGAALQQAVRP